MIYCPKCKSEIDSDSRFCDQCGQEVFYCSHCGRPGKGLRCTSCGAPMVTYDELDPAVAQNNATKRSSVTKRESVVAAAMGVTHRSGIPQLMLINDSLHLQLAGTDGAVLGRRTGIYRDVLSVCHYISGTHAQLAYSVQGGWTITDRGSSNGTFINGRKLIPNEASRIVSGDRVVLANVEFRVDIK